MTDYNSQLETLKKMIDESAGVISPLERRTIEGAYQAFVNNPETEIVGSVAKNLRGVLEHIDLYRYNSVKNKALTSAILVLEEITKQQELKK